MWFAGLYLLRMSRMINCKFCGVFPERGHVICDAALCAVTSWWKYFLGSRNRADVVGHDSVFSAHFSTAPFCKDVHNRWLGSHVGRLFFCSHAEKGRGMSWKMPSGHLVPTGELLFEMSDYCKNMPYMAAFALSFKTRLAQLLLWHCMKSTTLHSLWLCNL